MASMSAIVKVAKVTATSFEPERFIGAQLSKYICSVCQMVSGDPVSMECGHVHCRVCLEKWHVTKKICPQCRGPGTIVPCYFVAQEVVLVFMCFFELIKLPFIYLGQFF